MERFNEGARFLEEYHEAFELLAKMNS